MKKTHTAILLILILSLAGAYALRKYNQRDPVFDLAKIGQQAPAFSLAALSGGQLKLSDYKGKLVLVNFWASWCPPCRAEIPSFIKIQNAYSDKPFTILGLAIEDKAAVSSYVKEMGINYPIAYGVETVHQTATTYGNPDGALPYSVLVGPDQKIVAIYSGLLSEDALEKIIKKNL